MEKQYFRRKMDKQLNDWLQSEGHSPALVYGIRQCGKSESIKQFAKMNFKYINSIDFWKTPNAISAFSESLEVDGILQDGLGMNKGYLYEVIIADLLYKAGIPLYYFEKDSGLEIDLLILYNGFATLVEAKAKTGNTKSSKQVMNHPEHYGKTKLIKIGDYNISEEGDIITIPHYLSFVIGKNNL